MALSDIASAQKKEKNPTMNALMHLLNYAATPSDDRTTCYASIMIFHGHRDGSYLLSPKATS